ncbi:MAG TPA: restriction endonuclease subunit S, partial [Negativicutes bacterium]|nr:restriction endonuclease subunit S [Negativicutes bacterium]
MGSEWKRMLLGDFINLKRGFDLPTTTRTNGECLVYSSSGISGAHNIHICEPPGVITGRYGTIGQVFYAPKPYWPLNTTLYVEDFKGNEPKFVYYYLKTIPWQQFTQKSAVPGVNRNDVHRLEVTIPPVLIQHSIAATLSALDDKIELNNRIIANLEAQAQAIFKSWFVDFEPFQDGEFEESELGLIPKGWKKFTFSEILTPKTEKDNSPDIPEYSVTNTGIFTREEKYKKKLSMTNSANKIIRRGDLVFGMSRTIL